MARILIADDSPSIRFLITTLVTEAGHEVVLQAKDGLEALNAYYETNPDLLIIDYKMPIMDGITLIDEITKDDPDAKFLMCTGSFEEIENVIRLKKDVKVLQKPFDINEFFESVATTLANHS
ncbi:response regulator [Paenibacillus alginolyticus]|uniref:response regulator n=1 Tax=Paenibacillus alginolyticus TaxID=59839 RepID=UPI000423A130|nr:response regulator [Paenibacillus alginolyticus]MCY9667553.1 response regulator [Paenibacillus alginolyticus]